MPFEVAYIEASRQRNLRKLQALFTEADADGSGRLDLDEFRGALRQPGFQRAFSALGVQPHQSELVFKSMCNGVDVDEGDLSITEFMRGLMKLVGTDVDGTGRELDLALLRPTREATMRREQGLVEMMAASSSPKNARARASKGGMGRCKSQAALTLGAVHLLPEAQVQRAFVHSASAMALASAHSVAAARRPSRGLRCSRVLV